MSDIKHELGTGANEQSVPQPEITVTPVGHSGDLGLEFPVRSFTDTPLADVETRLGRHEDISGLTHLIANPNAIPPLAERETIEDYVPTDEELQEALEELKAAETAEKAGNKRPLTSKAIKWIVTTAAGLVVVGSAIFVGNNIANSNDDTTTPPEAKPPVAEEQGSSTPEIKVPTVESLVIPAGQGPEATAEAVNNLFSEWGMAGATKETLLGMYTDENMMDPEAYIDKVVDANAAVYAEAIYGPNYTDPKFQDAINDTKTYNRSNIVATVQTFGSNSDVPYYQHIIFGGATYVDNGDGTTTYTSEGIRDDNAEENMVEDNDGDGRVTVSTYVAAEVDGRVQLVEPRVFK